MNRLPLIGAVAAGLMLGVLSPAAANASTHAMGAGPHVHTAGAAGHMRAAGAFAHAHVTGATGHDRTAGALVRRHPDWTTARTHAAAPTAVPGTARPVPIGTPIALTVIGHALQFMPTILGVGVQR